MKKVLLMMLFASVFCLAQLMPAKAVPDSLRQIKVDVSVNPSIPANSGLLLVSIDPGDSLKREQQKIQRQNVKSSSALEMVADYLTECAIVEARDFLDSKDPAKKP